MKRAITLGLLALPLLAAPSDQSRWKFEDKETIHKSFTVAKGDNVSKLYLDQINGYVHVTGSSGNEVKVTLDRHTRAESQAALGDAKKDVKYDMTQQGNTVKLYEDGPFRSSNGNHYRGDDYYGYSVVFDCDVEVPAGASLELHTMNNEITVSNSTGDFTIHDMNGKVTMDGIGGNGSVDAMNGPVKVSFIRNPSHDSTFKTMNGPIDLYFPSTPDADLDLKTMNGGVFADFEVTTMPTTAKGEIGNRFIYRTGGAMKVRAGKGGPALSLHTMNGPIRLHSKI